jgi:hypothetical protein
VSPVASGRGGAPEGAPRPCNTRRANAAHQISGLGMATTWFDELTRKLAARDGSAPVSDAGARPRRLAVGRQAPAFALPSTRGRRFDLVDLRRDGRALLLFVPYTGG